MGKTPTTSSAQICNRCRKNPKSYISLGVTENFCVSCLKDIGAKGWSHSDGTPLSSSPEIAQARLDALKLFDVDELEIAICELYGYPEKDGHFVGLSWGQIIDSLSAKQQQEVLDYFLKEKN